ncbi:S26 family signal peptidase [Bordetella petrii]|uniref:Conjugal transfer protein TraF n=2 Tax=Bordetella petrii TaxID=94624 RepID=A9IEW6_BORPD|nr:S26 family signal peptidase [Bordetella petrii]MBO9353174.1 S26 family signal peptidase [Bordetella petrii]CAP44918.1 conjugal transfer protein TraF [Bordetella petrii]
MSDVPCVACRPAWRYRVAVLASTTVGLAAILASGLLRAVAPAAASGDPVATFAPRLVYNASDSVPRGFYVIHAQPPRVGDTILTRLPGDAARRAAERGYLPAGVPLIKPIAAGYGDHVCVRNGIVRINGRVVTRTLTHDRQGRPMSAWPGCRLLTIHEWFLLGTTHPASFDSRYFGPVTHAAAYGVAVPLWVWGTP